MTNDASEHVPDARATGGAPRTLGRAASLLIVGVGLIVVVALLGWRATLNEHEVYAAEPAREMLAGENWLLQPFAGAYRTKKPPGQSWLIAASMFVTRGGGGEFAARLPSALAAIGLALVAGALGARLAGRRVGVVAGLMLLTCYAVQVRARLAEADMALACFVALSYAGVLLPLLRGRVGGGPATASSPRALLAPIRLGGAPWLGVRFGDGLLFWVALAAAFLLKGPIAFGFVLLPLAAFLIVASLPNAGDVLRDGRRVVAAAMLNPVGLAVALLLIVGWPVGALMTYPAAWDQWNYELFTRAAGGIRRDPIVAYLGFVPMAALPWTPFAIAALVAGRGRWAGRLRGDPAALILALWLGVGVVFLSFIAFKRMHYALPVVTPVILARAWGFDRVLAAFLARRPEGRRRGLGRAAIAGWIGVAGAAWVAGQALAKPDGLATREFADGVNADVPAGATVWLVGVGEERTVFYLRGPVRQTRFRDDESLDAQLARLPVGEPSYVLCRATSVDDLAARGVAVEPIRTSRSYRDNGDESERRALVRATVSRATTAPATAAPASRPAE